MFIVVIKFTRYFTLGKGHGWEIFTKCRARLGHWLVLTLLSEKVATSVKKASNCTLFFDKEGFRSPNVEIWSQHVTSVF
jgi:hypothetical protein